MFVIFCPFSLRNTILYNFSKQKIIITQWHWSQLTCWFNSSGSDICFAEKGGVKTAKIEITVMHFQVGYKIGCQIIHAVIEHK